jgi:hypothetical protein
VLIRVAIPFLADPGSLMFVAIKAPNNRPEHPLLDNAAVYSTTHSSFA